MSARVPFSEPSDGDYTYRKLVARVIRGDPEAWTEFVERFSNLLFSLLWRYANGDEDLCANLYLFVIEGLHQTNEAGESFFRLRRYLQSVDQYDGKGRLTTWLGRVTQNLVSDYFREREGRKTVPRSIQRLDLTRQQIFKLLYWDCLAEREAFQVIKNKVAKLTRDEFDRIVVQINQRLKTCNRWSIYSEVIRKTPALPLHPYGADQTGAATQVQVADDDPASSPALTAMSQQEKEAAEEMGRVLRRAIAELPSQSRLLLVCRFKHGMTAGEIARLLKRRDEKKIYTELERLKDRLKQALEQAGFQWKRVELGLEAIEGLLDEFDPDPRGKPEKRM
jgi:RNA polymerase sigma factor (sigma-70 family)